MKHSLGNIGRMLQLILLSSIILLPVSSPYSSLLMPFLSRHSHFPVFVFALSYVSSLALDFFAASVPCGYTSRMWLWKACLSLKFPPLVNVCAFIHLCGKMQSSATLPCHPFPLCFAIPLHSQRTWSPPGRNPGVASEGGRASTPEVFRMCWALGTFASPILLGA